MKRLIYQVMAVLAVLIISAGCASSDNIEDEPSHSQLVSRELEQREAYEQDLEESGLSFTEIQKERVKDDPYLADFEKKELIDYLDNLEKRNLRAEKRIEAEERFKTEYDLRKKKYRDLVEEYRYDVEMTDDRAIARARRIAEARRKAVKKVGGELTLDDKFYGPGTKDFREVKHFLGETPLPVDFRTPVEKLKGHQAAVFVKMIPDPESVEEEPAKVPMFTCYTKREGGKTTARVLGDNVRVFVGKGLPDDFNVPGKRLDIHEVGVLLGTRRGKDGRAPLYKVYTVVEGRTVVKTAGDIRELYKVLYDRYKYVEEQGRKIKPIELTAYINGQVPARFYKDLKEAADDAYIEDVRIAEPVKRITEDGTSDYSKLSSILKAHDKFLTDELDHELPTEVLVYFVGNVPMEPYERVLKAAFDAGITNVKIVEKVLSPEEK